jgi:hypothetical protein
MKSIQLALVNAVMLTSCAAIILLRIFLFREENFQ